MKFIFLILIAAIASLSGCQNRVTGGAAGHTTTTETVEAGRTVAQQGNIRVRVSADGTLEVTRESGVTDQQTPASVSITEASTTTQPDVHTYGNNLPVFGAADAGSLGTLSITAVKSTFLANWPFFVIFALAGVACWFLGARIWAVACGGLAFIGLWQPAIIGWLAIGVVCIVGFYAYQNRKALVQTVNGIERAKDKLGADSVEPTLRKLAEAQDADVKSLIKTMR